MQPNPHQEPLTTQPRSKIEKPMVKDPVCGMEVESGAAPGGNATYEGETYDFCSRECHDRFEANPGAYAAPH